MRPARQSFVKGAAILTAATMAVKLIGMLYKIPLGNILGASGMSYFLSAYSIFNPIYALSVSGFPVAVSKLVSEQLAKGRYRDVRRIRRVSSGIFLCTGLAGSVVLFFGAGFFARVIDNPGAAMSIAAIAPSIFFCCIMSSYRGYYQGLSNMTPTAVSQMVESVAKLVFGIVFALLVLQRGLSGYGQNGMVFGQSAATPEQAQLLVLPWAAAGAVLGVTASTVVGALVLFLRHAFGGDGIRADMHRSSPAPRPAGTVARTLVRIALPVCLASLFAHVANLIDVATVMTRVGAAIARDAGTVLGMYAGALPAAIDTNDVPSFLYGAFGYTTSLFNLIPALTVSFGVSALPSVSGRWALGERRHVAVQAASILKLSALIAIPAGLGLSALAEPILALLYPARLEEIAIAAPLLRTMGYAAVLVGITSPMTSVFQAIGRADMPLKLIAAGCAIKFCANWTLLAVPELNIAAAPYSTILCYGFVLLGGAVALHRELGAEMSLPKLLAKPLFCGIMCAVSANTSYEILSRHWQSRLAVLPAIALGAAVYAIFVLFLKIITKNEVLLLPKGQKIVIILEKLSLLG